MTVQLIKKALYLSYFTVSYNVLEGILSVLAGLLAGSIALIGFGFDSGIESFSGAVLIWRLTRHGKIPPEEEERVEKRAVRLVGISFFVLGAYVFYEAAKKLFFHEHPEPSLFGIIIAILSLIIMPILSYMKFKTAKTIGSMSLEADSRQTFLCSLLSVVLLAGLGLNYLFGLWWADPIGAFVMLFFVIREGIETLKKEKACCC
ncbi:MAG: cation transporter [Deltaproteobacteria bacterium]|nr:cation transporter [Deltaproteobacteria bacterium]